MYEKGLGVEQSYEKAMEWYLVAAPSPEVAAGNVHPRIFALTRLGYFYEKGIVVQRDTEQAIAWYRVAAKNHDPEAEAALARLSPRTPIFPSPTPFSATKTKNTTACHYV